MNEDTAKGAIDRGPGPGWKPAVVIVAIALVIRFVPGWVAPMTMAHFIGLGVGPLVGILGLLVWWVFSKRLPRRDKWLGLAMGLLVLVAGFALSHPTMPQVLVMYGLVLLMVAFAATLFLTRSKPWTDRRWILLLVWGLVFLPWLALRQDGQTGALAPELSARWRPTPEEMFLEDRAAAARNGVAPVATTAGSDWPGYRGPARDGHARGVTFASDWGKQPPREIWRRRVGPGWSSFAVVGDLVFTQEQRGAEDVVVCYSLTDGSEIWAHGVPERFEEPASGAGPRATPTFSDGRVFALTANSTLVSLDAATGDPHWQRNLIEELGAALPTWAFSGSPLVLGRAVLVFAGAEDGQSVAAYDRDTGERLWSSGTGTMSYGSPHPAVLDGVEQVLMSTDAGLQAFDPQSGDVLWEHAWPLTGMARIVQPVVLDDGKSLILPTGYGEGSRRLNVERGAAGDWRVEEVWSTLSLKPYFNGLVCHRGTCFGFDGRIFTAIGADDGERRWKGGRYGHGQVVLLDDMDLLLVLTEKGDVVLVEATPEAHREVARLPALAGKTWNHPVISQGRLLVRNAEEAACYELGAA
ncbi:MAG: PQQ-binding-like beta-propeller repeat protein [Acidobacteriota bacterium]|nr:PQQ-binding-like beta-propeller repeat protein [Acidobacteriota bacterium]